MFFLFSGPTSTANYRVWDKESQKAVLEAFGESVTGESPFTSSAKIHSFLRTTPLTSLKGRSEPQIRSWLHNQRKLYCQNKQLPEKRSRDRTPNAIYILFSENIRNKIMPSVGELAMTYEKSPSLQGYSIKQLKEFFQNIIERNNA